MWCLQCTSHTISNLCLNQEQKSVSYLTSCVEIFLSVFGDLFSVRSPNRPNPEPQFSRNLSHADGALSTCCTFTTFKTNKYRTKQEKTTILLIHFYFLLSSVVRVQNMHMELRLQISWNWEILHFYCLLLGKVHTFRLSSDKQAKSLMLIQRSYYYFTDKRCLVGNLCNVHLSSCIENILDLGSLVFQTKFVFSQL